MTWPSKRIPQGGAFNSAKVRYSLETRKFIDDLIQENKMLVNRKREEAFFQTGAQTRSKNDNSTKPKSTKVVIKPGPSRRRSLLTIANSEACRPQKYTPKQAPVDREMAKKHLQNIMAKGKDSTAELSKPKEKPKSDQDKDMNRFDQLIKEISEREEWLKQMTDFQADPKYRTIIEQQIQSKVREMELLKSDADGKE